VLVHNQVAYVLFFDGVQLFFADSRINISLQDMLIAFMGGRSAEHLYIKGKPLFSVFLEGRQGLFFVIFFEEVTFAQGKFGSNLFGYLQGLFFIRANFFSLAPALVVYKNPPDSGTF